MVAQTVTAPRKNRADQLRETCKWLMTIFGAVDGVLIAGLQLTGLGKAEGPWLIAAIAGFVLAISGVGLIIWQLTQVFGAGVVNRTVLNRFYRLKKDGTEIAPGSKKGVVGGIIVDDPTWFRGRYKSLTEFVEALDVHQGQWWQLTPQQLALPANQSDAQYFNAVQSELNYYMGQALVSQQFRESIAGSFLGFALSALGIAVFAYAVGQQAPVEAIKAQTLNPQFLTLSQTAMPKYEASFGKDCAAGPVGVYVLGKGSTSLDVLSIPSDKCKATRVTVPTSDATLTTVSH